MAYATIQDVLNFLPGLERNSSNDIADGAIQTLLNVQQTRIESVALRKGYTLPSPTATPTTNRDFLLFLLNVEQPAAKVIYRRSMEVDQTLANAAGLQLRVAEHRMKLFESGWMDLAWASVLPVTPMCTAADVAAFLPGFQVKEDPRNGPSKAVLERWIAAESALVYAYASYLAYTTNLATATSNQLNEYKNLVMNRTAANLVRSRAETYPQALNSQANQLLIDSDKLYRSFLNRDTSFIFT